jgi:hypothetical protein
MRREAYLAKIKELKGVQFRQRKALEDHVADFAAG